MNVMRVYIFLSKNPDTPYTLEHGTTKREQEQER